MQLVFLVLNSLGLAGLFIFLWFVFQGLKEHIAALTALATEQSRTLDAVRQRAEEFDRLSKGYKQALADFEEMGAKLDARRATVVKELEVAVQQRDEQIVQLKESELKTVNLKLQSISELPQLLAQLEQVRREFRRQINVLSNPDPEIDIKWSMRDVFGRYIWSDLLEPLYDSKTDSAWRATDTSKNKGDDKGTGG